MPFQIITVSRDSELPSSKIGGPAQNYNDYGVRGSDMSLAIRKRLAFRLGYIAIGAFVAWMLYIMLRDIAAGKAKYSPWFVVPAAILFVFFLYESVFERATLIDKRRNKVTVSPLSPFPLNRQEYGFGDIAGVVVVYCTTVGGRKRRSTQAYELNILIHKTGSNGINLARHSDYKWLLETGESIARMIDVPLYYVSRDRSQPDSQ